MSVQKTEMGRQDPTQRTFVKASEDVDNSRSKMIDAIPMNIVIFRVYGDSFIVLDFNKMAEKTEVISKEDVLDRDVKETFPGLKDMGLLDVFKRVYESGESEVFDAAYYHDERISGWRKNTVSKLDENTIMAAYEDVSLETEQKLKELDELKKHKIYLEKSQKIAHIGVWEIDMVENILYWSDEIYEIVGRDKDNYQPTPDNFLESIHIDDRDMISTEFTNSIAEKKDYSISHRTLRPDGSIRFVEELGEHTYDDNGEVIKSFGVSIDVTERKKNEDEIKHLNQNLQSEVARQLKKIREKDAMLIEESKFSLIGKSVGNVAHQWKRPLSQLNTLFLYMQGLYYVGDEKKLLETFDDSMQKVSSIMEYMKSSIEELHHFYTDSHTDKEFNLVRQMRLALTLQEDRLVLNNIAVNIKCDEKIFMTGAKHAFSNILTILFDNSIDQFEKNKIVNAVIDINVSQTNDTLEIVFKDNAGGINAYPIERVFDMYFSTKRDEGYGMGLALAKKLARIAFFSDIGVKNSDGGAEFLITKKIS